MQLPVLLDRSRPDSLTNQLVEQLRDAIRRSMIAPGAKLPSSRRLADQLDVSRNTVVRAYDILLMEGEIESRPASGMYVAMRPPEGSVQSPSIDVAQADDVPYQMPLPWHAARAQNLVHQNRARLSFDFYPGRPNAGLFPIKTWRRILQSVLSHGGAVGLSQYSDPAGLIVLRSAIADQLAAARGIIADPSRIVIVGGIQEGLSIAAQLFLRPGSLGAVEEPCYQGAAFAFEATGADVVSVPVDESGLIADELPQRPTSLLYITPSHQYPTGHTLAPVRRRDILAWARRRGCYILEDDYDGDFRYEGSPLPAVAAMAPDCTIYLGTFSKSLGAGLRLGYMVVPTQIAEATRVAKTLLNNGNAWLEQAALAEMMRCGSYAAHLMRIRASYKESRDALLASLQRHFGQVDVSGEAGGLHCLWRLPAGVPDAAVLEALARSVRIGVYSLTSGGAYEARPSALTRRGIILGYALLTPNQIEQGIARLSDVVDEAIDDPLADINQLFARDAAQPYVPRAKVSAHLASRNLQQPALLGLARRRARWIGTNSREDGSAMPVVRHIYRYPIKGLSPQPMSSVLLEPKKPFPHDRIFALARPGAPIDQYSPRWAKKALFVMLMLDESLAQVKTRLDVETLDLTIMSGNEQLMVANLGDEGQRGEVEAFFHRLVPALPGAPALLRSPDGHFMDKPDNVISLINLATVRSLEEQWGFEIDPLRFRANIYIDGARPWEEFDWIGRDIRLGDALFRVDRRNGRCGATNVNPETGRRDLDIPGSLRAAFGHKDLGVYLMTRKGGQLAVGDTVAAPQTDGAQLPHGAVERMLSGGSRRFICRGCYYIYEESRGLPQHAIAPGTPFAILPTTWRCPDCGTDKTTFRPYVTSGGAKEQSFRRDT
jgi:GntR family transcriptional regulator / MocR family aminotransferase